ncbi:Expansin-A13 protein [Spatholobus suberectus]|nr:Expansin-A13 protein [Spatholobus suberectus]
MATVALNEALFSRGQIYGAYFKLHCRKKDASFNRYWCVANASIAVTATNFCALNYNFDAKSIA